MDILLKYQTMKLEESGDVPRWFWLSFADPNLPTGTQFLGAAIVKAQGVATATEQSNLRGINPGGEIQFTELPLNAVPNPKYINRLLSKAEIEAADDADDMLIKPDA